MVTILRDSKGKETRKESSDDLDALMAEQYRYETVAHEAEKEASRVAREIAEKRKAKMVEAVAICLEESGKIIVRGDSHMTELVENFVERIVGAKPTSVRERGSSKKAQEMASILLDAVKS